MIGGVVPRCSPRRSGSPASTRRGCSTVPTRAWQLGSAVFSPRRPGGRPPIQPRAGPDRAGGGLGLIAGVYSSKVDALPGTAALLPAVATAAVVVGGPAGSPRRLLSLAPASWFGRTRLALPLALAVPLLPVLALGRSWPSPAARAGRALDRGRDGELAMDRGAVPSGAGRYVSRPDRPPGSGDGVDGALAVGVGEGVVTRLDATASETAFVSEEAAYAMASAESGEDGGVDGWGTRGPSSDRHARPTCERAYGTAASRRRPADVGSGWQRHRRSRRPRATARGAAAAS